ATPPAGWLKCDGRAFTKEQYPVLARVYPTLRLPDLRGEFIRGWDDGRKVDTFRPSSHPRINSPRKSGR
ncbi:tail fiber protein, partial [Escherichia coli]|nr:tail fiber protein [Escherichia coli]